MCRTQRHATQIFLWFWFLFVAVASAFSILVWLKRLLFLRTRRAFIGKFLKYMETFATSAGGNDKRLWQCFVEGFLRCDGVFVIHILSDKAGDVVTGEVVCTMWEYFKVRPGPNAPTSPTTPTTHTGNHSRHTSSL